MANGANAVRLANTSAIRPEDRVVKRAPNKKKARRSRSALLHYSETFSGQGVEGFHPILVFAFNQLLRVFVRPEDNRLRCNLRVFRFFDGIEDHLMIW